MRQANKLAQGAIAGLRTQSRPYTQARTHTPPRHLMTIADLSPAEFAALVRNAAAHKALVKGADANHAAAVRAKMAGQTVAMMFNKRSTRTRVSTEAAVTLMGGHPMFLGKDDIQLGVSGAPSPGPPEPLGLVSNPVIRNG